MHLQSLMCKCNTTNGCMQRKTVEAGIIQQFATGIIDRKITRGIYDLKFKSVDGASFRSAHRRNHRCIRHTLYCLPSNTTHEQ